MRLGTVLGLIMAWIILLFLVSCMFAGTEATFGYFGPLRRHYWGAGFRPQYFHRGYGNRRWHHHKGTQGHKWHFGPYGG